MSNEKATSTVKIWFEGLPQPIPARAESISDSQLLTVDLPYLQRNTQVFISDGDGDSSKGYMTEVSLVSGPKPQLQILVQTGEPVFEPVSEIPLMSPHSTDCLEAVELSRDPGGDGATPFSVDDRTSTIPLLTPLCEAPQEQSQRVPEDPTGPFSVETSAAPEHDPKQAPRAQDTVSPRARLEDVISRLPAPPAELERPPTRRWLWLAVLALVILAGGGVYFHAELQDRTIGTAEAATSPPQQLMPADSAQPEPRQPAARAPRVDPGSLPGSSPAALAPAPGNPPGMPEPREARPPVDRGAPRVWLGGKHPTLVIPMEGSTAGAQSYTLANPRGVAVNLPRARISVPKRQYRFLEGGFRLVNIMTENNGVFLRVYFQTPMPTYKLHIDPDAVRFTVYPR